MKPRELAYCGIFGAAALLLPVIFHVFHLGHVFMPMYLPLVTLAFFVRPGSAALTCLLVPLLSGAVTGMPPFVPPIAPVMAVELALIAILIGVIRAALKTLPVCVILAFSSIVGRVVNAALLYGAAQIMDLPAGFIAGISLLSGWPGLVLMMVVIPQIIRGASAHRGN